MTIYVICWRGTERLSMMEMAHPNEYFSTYEEAAKYQSDNFAIGQTYIRPLTKA